MRADGRIKDKCIYGVMGVDIEGESSPETSKEMLGLWIFDTEGAKSWLSVLADLKNRGVKDVLILTSDGLTGIEDAIEATFPIHELDYVSLLNCMSYSSRTGQGMSQIIKTHLESLKRQVISHVVPPSAYD